MSAKGSFRSVFMAAGLTLFVSVGCGESRAPVEPSAKAVGTGAEALGAACIGAAFEVPGAGVWATSFGDSRAQRARQVEIDPSGDLVVTGYFNGMMQLGSTLLSNQGGEDAWVGKFDPNGTPIWAIQYGSSTPQPDYTRGIAVASDAAGDLFVTGLLRGTTDFGGGPLTSAGGDDIFVLKLDASGNHLWSKRFGDAATQYSQAIEVDENGDLLLVGYFAGTVDVGTGPLASAGGYDALVAKLDGATGGAIWAARFGDQSYQDTWDLALDAAGGVTVIGNFRGIVPIGSASITSLAANDADMYLAHFSAAGKPLWAQAYAGVGDSAANSMTRDLDGNLLVTGSFAGAINFGGGVLSALDSDDVFLAKLDPVGNHLWSRAYPGADFQRAVDIAVDAAGNVVIVGRLKGSADFGGGLLVSPGSEDAFLAQVDTQGTLLWSHNYGDDQIQGAYGVAIDERGDVVVTGRYNSALDFGTGPMVSAGNRDVFLAKLAGMGCASACPAGGDLDDDGVCADVDNCPNDYNPSQEDTDADEVGDVCTPVCVLFKQGVFGAVADSGIRSNTPTTTYGAATQVFSGVLGGGVGYGLFRVDLGAIPSGAFVRSADVSLVVTATSPAALVAHRVVNPWAESTVTWSLFGSAFDPAPVATIGNAAPSSNQVVTLDLTPLVRAWVDGTTPNEGFLVDQIGGASTRIGTSESLNGAFRPAVSVCYTMPEP